MASVRLATGRAETGFSGGAVMASVSGHNVLMCGLSRMAYLSSNTNTPVKLVEYARYAAAASASATSRLATVPDFCRRTDSPAGRAWRRDARDLDRVDTVLALSDHSTRLADRSLDARRVRSSR